MTRPDGRLTVVSYNIRAAIGPGPFPAAWWRHVDRSRLEGIGQVIRTLSPDVVALQEVALTTIDGVVEDQAGELAQMTGLEPRYGAVGHFPIVDPESRGLIGASFWGNAILSRLPITRSRTFGLPIASDDDLVEPLGSALELAGVRFADAPVGVRERRCVLACEVEAPGGTVHVLATHLTHIGSGQRRLQADRITEVIGGLPGPVVLAGDLNAPIAAPELAGLADTLVDSFTATGAAVGDPARVSLVPAPLAIDHVLVRELDVRSCRVAREAGDLSDHWPVVAEVVSVAS